MDQTFSGEFKRSFGRGLAILLPSIVTLWILWQAFSFVYTNVAEPINKATRISVLWTVPRILPPEQYPAWYVVTPEEIEAADARGRFRTGTDEAIKVRDLRREQFRRVWNSYWILNLSGFIIAILLIYLAGLLLGNFFGRSIYGRAERLIASVPGFKQVYPHVKQVVDLVLGEKKMAFSKVVLVEYPSKDIWTIGFLTGQSIREIDRSAGGRVASVFIPTSPTPFTGFTINVETERVRPMDMTVEEALRFVITAGVLTPEGADKPPAPGPPPTLTQEEAEAVASRARKRIEESRLSADPDRAEKDA